MHEDGEAFEGCLVKSEATSPCVLEERLCFTFLMEEMFRRYSDTLDLLGPSASNVTTESWAKETVQAWTTQLREQAEEVKPLKLQASEACKNVNTIKKKLLVAETTTQAQQ